MKHVAVASAAGSHDKTALDSNPITMSKLAVALPLASCQCEIYELENNDVKDMEKGRARVWRENRKLLPDGGGTRPGKRRRRRKPPLHLSEQRQAAGSRPPQPRQNHGAMNKDRPRPQNVRFFRSHSATDMPQDRVKGGTIALQLLRRGDRERGLPSMTSAYFQIF